MDKFLESSNLFRVTDERITLTTDITEEEINKGISNLKANKSPGTEWVPHRIVPVTLININPTSTEGI